MGIGAFAYYRRVVENKKGQIFAAIIQAAEKMGAEPDVHAELRQAASERQFTRAVEVVKHGIPNGLRINGQDPLTLLHDALSEGLHAQEDEECLALARNIRVVLVALVERVAEVTREDKALNEAVADLLRRQRERRAEDKRGGVRPHDLVASGRQRAWGKAVGESRKPRLLQVVDLQG